MRKSILLIVISLVSIYQINAQKFSLQVEKFIAIKNSDITITNVTIIDGTGNKIKNNQTLVISNGSIEAVGNALSIQVPANGVIIDGTGKTIIPGLVMLHEHLFYTKSFEDWYSVDQMTFTFPRLYLAGGVTTMRTAASIQPQTDLNVKNILIKVR